MTLVAELCSLPCYHLFIRAYYYCVSHPSCVPFLRLLFIDIASSNLDHPTYVLSSLLLHETQKKTV